METEKQRRPPDHYARRLAEIKAVDMHALSDEALRGRAEDFRKRLLEAKAQKTA